MPLLNVVLTPVVVGGFFWLINTYIPMQSTIKSILNIVAVVAVIIGSGGDVHVLTVR